MKNYSLLFVSSNSGQGRYFMFTRIVLRKSLPPSHLLLGQRVLTKLDSDFNEDNMDCNASYRRVHYLQTLIAHYWNR